jgi:superfamily II RNA helicase
VEEPYQTGCEQRAEAEHRIRTTMNADRKEAQRRLDGIKNKQMGPKWTSAWTRYQEGRVLQKQLDAQKKDLDSRSDYAKDMEYVVQFLYEMKYVTHGDPYTLQTEHLTRKGILATEVNEGHPLLMTELYDSQLLHDLSGAEIVTVLACFLEGSTTIAVPITVCLPIQKAIGQMKQWIETYRVKEELCGYPIRGYWDISTAMVEPISRWIQGEDISLLCQEYEMFEGNMIRSIAKLSNLIEEWIAMATYCQHTNQVAKMMEIRSEILRGLMAPDSLYLRLSKK